MGDRPLRFWLVASAAALIGLAAVAFGALWLRGSAGAPALSLTRIDFAALTGWSVDDPSGARIAFLRSCDRLAELAPERAMRGAGYAGTVADWLPACDALRAVPPGAPANLVRAAFEAAFVPYAVAGPDGREGLFTGYFEPTLNGARTRGGAFQTPLYGRPGDLVTVDLGLFDTGLAGRTITGRVEGDGFVPYPTRAEIETGALGPDAAVVLWVDDPVDAFFLQIQGSGRVVLDDGTVVRAAYAAKNGRPWTPIGRVLRDMGELEPGNISMQSIRAWLAANPDRAAEIMRADESFVFFTEAPLEDPVLGATGAGGVPLSPMRSLAIDRTLHPYGAPIFVRTPAPARDAALPDQKLRMLMIAQDTGGAIRGAVRGDVYWGYDEAAAAIAGRMAHRGEMAVLLPRGLGERIGARWTARP